ncbi:MAG: SIR2 family NAD-dependent protein deacylase [Actinomycetota bacterium]
MTTTSKLAEIAHWIRSARRVIALTGAGISTDSGIPDFRGPNGVWTKDPAAERMSHIRHYMEDPEVRVLAWQGRLHHPAWTAEPNDAHRALVELERRDGLHTLVTQNIDGLHQLAGTSEDILIEIHGTMREVVCMTCDERAPMQRALTRVRAGEADPPCRSCGGILKSATVSFGQGLDPDQLERASGEAANSDLFLALGTSLGVYPVAYLPNRTLTNGGRLVIINAEPTGYDGRASAVLNAPLSEVMPGLAALV